MSDKPANPANPKQAYGDAKVQLQLVPPALMIGAAIALAEGADKYGAYNYRETDVESMTYIGAILRHALAFLDGEDIDPQSTRGKTHLDGIAGSLAVLMDSHDRGSLIDNRPNRGTAAKRMGEEEWSQLNRLKIDQVHVDETFGPVDYRASSKHAFDKLADKATIDSALPNTSADCVEDKSFESLLDNVIAGLDKAENTRLSEDSSNNKCAKHLCEDISTANTALSVNDMFIYFPVEEEFKEFMDMHCTIDQAVQANLFYLVRREDCTCVYRSGGTKAC